MMVKALLIAALSLSGVYILEAYTRWRCGK
jgi:hypothetical protein